MAGVFEGVRVVDLSWGIAGPMTSMLLADNGAQVTRLELDGTDPFRAQTGYRVWHRGKRSVSCDLHTDEGRQLALDLAGDADVVIESFSPGTTTRMGIDHQACSRSNPGLITCSITGYGPMSTLADRPGFDGLVAARTGLLFDQRGRFGSAMEFINGRPGPLPDFGPPEGLVRGADRDGPIFPRTSWPSVGATYFAALGIAAALRAREVTGLGQHVETSLLQGALAAACLNWQRVENPDAPLYWMWPVDSRSIEGLFECADGRWVHHWTLRPTWVLAASAGDTLEAEPLDTAYRDDPDRVSMEADGMLSGMFMYPDLAAAFKKFPSEQWIEAAEAVGVGVALVRSPGEALNDKSYLADGCVVEVDDPEVGRIRHAGPALEFSATPGAVTGPSPLLGADTATVLAEMPATYRGVRPGPSGVELTGPLDGVRVLDLGLGVAGPFTGRVLADLGADVIKVNALHDSFWAGTHMGLGTNRGKRSIAVNLKDPRGLDVLKRLVANTDVVTTNWRPGAAARLGLDFDTLHEHYPRLIHCNTRGYERGPRSDLPGTDQTAAALTGTEWVDGACDTGNPPLWSRSNMGDTGNALLAAIAITAALYHREVTGEGQAVSTSIVNAGLLHNSYAWSHAENGDANWERVDGDQYGLSPLYRLFRCADDNWIFVAAVQPHHRHALDLVVPGLRFEDRDELASTLVTTFEQGSASEWFDRLDRVGVPVEVVDATFCRRLFDDPEARAVGLISETQSGNVGRFEDPGLLVNFSATPGVIQRGPCMSGEHSREILVECGFDSEEIDELARSNVILEAG